MPTDFGQAELPASELDKVRAALEECERRSAALLQGADDLIFCLDREGKHLGFHAPSLDRLFRQPQEFLGHTVSEVLPPEVAERYMRSIVAVLADGQAHTFDYALPLPRRGLQHYEARLVPNGSDQVLAIVRNVTERRQLQDARVRTQKLASVGLLAGGIAHDFNNLLTPIVANLGAALSLLPAGSPAEPFLRDAAAASQRSIELMRQLLAYTGRGTTQREEVDLGALFREMAELQSSAFPQVELRFDLADPLPLVLADPTQLRQVAANLLANAGQALGEAGGEVHVETWAEELDAAALAQVRPDKALTPGTYACVRVMDTGPGLAPEHHHLIFDPYFTTKPTGTGLGLAIVLGVVRAHEGAVRVESEPGRGASFTLYFPALDRSDDQALRLAG
ncbi:MAG: nitrogen regulation protein NR(II) [Planctomycetota bacterium]